LQLSCKKLTTSVSSSLPGEQNSPPFAGVR
jgi:hypothetical protein